jgi:chemotaxis-related protein WspD
MSEQSSKRALHLLDREPPADYLAEWTERVAAKKEDVDLGTTSVLIFRIAVEWLALPVSIFQEAAENCVLHTIPHRRGGIIDGLVTIRGELLLCAALAKLLGIERDSQDGQRPICPRLLVTNRGGNHLAFPVDEIHGVVRYHPRELLPVPASLAQAAAIYTIGLLPWQNRTVGCLNDELLFHTLNKSFS